MTATEIKNNNLKLEASLKSLVSIYQSAFGDTKYYFDKVELRLTYDGVDKVVYDVTEKAYFKVRLDEDNMELLIDAIIYNGRREKYTFVIPASQAEIISRSDVELRIFTEDEYTSSLNTNMYMLPYKLYIKRITE